MRAQTQLIDDLLDVSRIVSGRLRLDIQTVELAPIIATCVDSIRPAAAKKGVALDAVLDFQAFVSGDTERLQQVVWNLVSNAVKFTPKGGRVQFASTARSSIAEVRCERHRARHRTRDVCPTSSTASGRPTARRRGATAGSDSGSRSRGPSWSFTEARSGPRARVWARARRSRSAFRSPSSRSNPSRLPCHYRSRHRARPALTGYASWSWRMNRRIVTCSTGS